MKKLVIVINGRGGVGKDTLCDSLRRVFRVKNISAITPIKEIARVYGWNGEKDFKSRRFLAELKRVFADYNDLPNRYLLGEYEKFASDDNDILCVHIREKDQIDEFVHGVTLPCITLLVKRSTGTGEGKYGNDADDLVEEYDYDYVFDNSAPIEESGEKFIELISGIMDAEGAGGPER